MRRHAFVAVMGIILALGGIVSPQGRLPQAAARDQPAAWATPIPSRDGANTIAGHRLRAHSTLHAHPQRSRPMVSTIGFAHSRYRTGQASIRL